MKRTLLTAAAVLAAYAIGMVTECSTQALHVAHITGNYRSVFDAGLRIPAYAWAEVRYSLSESEEAQDESKEEL